jgi:choline dehydrogenase-like flavoprotein
MSTPPWSATFHSSGVSSEEAPDLMPWLSDPRGSPPVFEIDVGLLRPRSRGSVRLRSADPSDPPRVELPGLREAFDLERMIEAYGRGLEVAHRPELRRLCADSPPSRPQGADELREVVRAGATRTHTSSVRAQWARVPRTARSSMSAAVCTAPSIWPSSTPTIMLAERLAEQIASTL